MSDPIKQLLERAAHAPRRSVDYGLVERAAAARRRRRRITTGLGSTVAVVLLAMPLAGTFGPNERSSLDGVSRTSEPSQWTPNELKVVPSREGKRSVIA